jgi:hypothetical protein
LLFVVAFVYLASFYLVVFLAATDVIQLDIIMISLFAFLIATGIVATIGIVMLGFKTIYLLPALIVIIIFFYYQTLESNYTSLLYSARYLSTIAMGYFVGNPWFISIKAAFPNLFVQRLTYTNLLNLLLDPIAIIFPNPTVSILAFCEGGLAVPTTILFYYLAWKNRSGRSLGFALGITTYLILGALTLLPDIVIRVSPGIELTFIATLFFALGILGPLDKLISRGKPQEELAKKEKT